MLRVRRASDICGTYKSNSALSSTAKKAAADIETGLLAQAAHIRDSKLDDFDTHKRDLIQMTAQINLAAVKKGLNSADVFIKKVESSPLRATFNAGIQEACRPLTVPLGNIGAINGKADPKPLGKNREKWADGKDLLPATATQKDVLEALKTYQTAIDGIKHWAA